MKTFLQNLPPSLLVLLLVLTLSHPAAAHGGEDHAGEAATTTAGGAQYFSVFTNSEQFEVLVRYEPLEPGGPAHLRLFLADFATNAPIRGAKLTLTSPENAPQTFQTTEQGPGEYLVETVFPRQQAYKLTVQVVAGERADLLLVEGVEVGKKLPVAAEMPPASAPWLSWQTGLLLLGGFLAGLAVAVLLLRRRRVSSPSNAMVHENAL